jgi:hypothetical protein
MLRRDPAAVVSECFDPLARFYELEAVFGDEGGMFGDPISLRYAVANLLMCPGKPDEIESAVRATHASLHQHIPWTGSLPHAIWPLVATVLVQRGDDAAAFAFELNRVRAIMRSHGVRRHAAYELIAVLVLRIRNGLAPITEEQIARVRAVYDQMKRHHWLLTGPEDLPACAMLALSSQEPKAIGDRANAIYDGLRARSLARSGDPLHTASHVLALSPRPPAELVERFANLVVAFEDVGIRVHRNHYDEVAVLCLLDVPAQRIADAVSAYQASIRSRLNWADREHTVPIAANIAFMRMLGDDPELDALADAKVLLDLQSVLAAAS